MSTDYIDIIKKVSLFRGLKEEAIVELLSSFSIVEVPENALLFSQGDNAGSMYILLSGYLLATLKTKDGHIENIGKKCCMENHLVSKLNVLVKMAKKSG